MKKILLMINIIMGLIASSCDSDDMLLIVEPEGEGSFVDVRDDETYNWVSYNGLDWMTENLRYESEIGQCEIYSLSSTSIIGEVGVDIFERYGLLYDNEAALSACPEGWRLPSDKDWQNLESVMGVPKEDLNKKGWRGKDAGRLLKLNDEYHKIHLRLGGFKTPIQHTVTSRFRYLGVYGYFWTSDLDAESDLYLAYYRQIAHNLDEIFRYSCSVSNLYSVRCVRDSK